MPTVSIYPVDTRKQAKGYVRDPAIPFDKFYLIPRGFIASMKQLVPFSMVMPLTEAYKPSLSRMGYDTDDLIQRDYMVAVPILMERAETESGPSSTEVSPTYIAKRTWQSRSRRLAEFIPEDVIMTTPEGVLNPMCGSCENSLIHINGECRVGGPDCLVSLKLNSKAMNELARAKAEPKQHETLNTIHKLSKGIL
jgi:hypothetical protein